MDRIVALPANDRPTVKLADNPGKAIGPAGIARDKPVFGVAAQDSIPLRV